MSKVKSKEKTIADLKAEYASTLSLLVEVNNNFKNISEKLDKVLKSEKKVASSTKKSTEVKKAVKKSAEVKKAVKKSVKVKKAVIKSNFLNEFIRDVNTSKAIEIIRFCESNFNKHKVIPPVFEEVYNLFKEAKEKYKNGSDYTFPSLEASDRFFGGILRDYRTLYAELKSRLGYVDSDRTVDAYSVMYMSDSIMSLRRHVIEQ